MRIVPTSLFGRMFALSLLATLAALMAAGVAISGVLQRFVTGGVDSRLGDRMVALQSAVRLDGTIDRGQLDRVTARIPVDEPWRIDTPRTHVGSRDATGGFIIQFDDDPRWAGPPPVQHDGPPDHPPDPHGGRRNPAGVSGTVDTRPFDARLTDGLPVHGLIGSLPITADAGSAEAVVALPRRKIDRPVLTTLVPLAASLTILGLALGAAALVQLRLGLRPLRRLREAVESIRHGSDAPVPDDVPDELRPLATELNALVADNRAALATARGSAANLAHALKTPLATLSLAVREPGRDPDGSLRSQVERLDATVRHHLARARAEVAESRVATALTPALCDLADTVQRIHAERGVTVTIDAPDDLFVALAAADLDELAGNLLDNAVRYACTTVRVAAARRERTLTLSVEDDGPGIAAADLARATAPGMRLDERGDGHGFGLAIARELAALYGGSLELGSGALGGLSAQVTLPAARAPGS